MTSMESPTTVSTGNGPATPAERPYSDILGGPRLLQDVYYAPASHVRLSVKQIREGHTTRPEVAVWSGCRTGN